MTTNPLASLETDATTEKRAQYEAFEFDVSEKEVEVRNESHADADEHTYVVSVRDGVPVACECPADEYHDGACKHRVAVAIREPVLKAADSQPVAADGGTNMPPGFGSRPGDDEHFEAPEQASEPESPAVADIAITTHIEPPEQGGARYARCESCEQESIHGADRIVHRDECPAAEVQD